MSYTIRLITRKVCSWNKNTNTEDHIDQTYTCVHSRIGYKFNTSYTKYIAVSKWSKNAPEENSFTSLNVISFFVVSFDINVRYSRTTELLELEI